MSANTVEITDANFETEVKNSNVPVLVDFWATWCGPCKAIAPHLEALGQEYAGKVKIGKLDVDEQTKTATTFGIRSIPTMILFKNGEPVDQIIGGVPKNKIEEVITKHL